MNYVRTDYLETGSAYLTNDNDKTIVEREKKDLTWHDLPQKGAPFMQAWAIKEYIKNFKLPATKIAWDGCLSGMSTERGANYGFYGIEASYNDGTTIRIYIIDDGVSVKPLFVDVYQN